MHQQADTVEPRGGVLVPFGIGLLTEVGSPRPATMATSYTVPTSVQTTFSNPEDGGPYTTSDPDTTVRND